MIFKGVFDRLELLEDCLIIRRTPVVGLLVHGIKGEKRIPYSAITSIQFKRSGLLSGYMQLSIPGGNESTKGMWDAMSDENTVVFADNEAFEKARDIIETRMRQARNPFSASPLGGGTSAAEQLEKLASLLDRGLLTQQEFDAQKNQLLGKVPSVEVEPQSGSVEPPSSETEDRGSLAKMHAAMDRAINSHQQQPDRKIPFVRNAPTFGRRGA